MILWLDDVRKPPNNTEYAWYRTVNEAKEAIVLRETMNGIAWQYSDGLTETIAPFELLDLDHDSGDFACDGGDYIRLLDWLEETGRNYPIRIHSMNPVGRNNMRAIIRKNGWREVF